jgi:hypothetical protein
LPKDGGEQNTGLNRCAFTTTGGNMFRRALLLPLAAAALAVGACDSPTANSGQARLTVLLTDAPHEYLEEAVVTIGRIDILPVNGPPITITNDGGTFDLLQLQDGVTAVLGSADIDPDRYRELRMVVSYAEVTLKDGYTFNDGSQTKSLHVPSGAASGIKIGISDGNGGPPGQGIEIRPGETVLVVDFDVSQNFVMLGDADAPAGIEGFNFTPRLRAVAIDVAGSISGFVTAPDDIDVEGLTVTATREGAEEDEAAITTLVREDGTFTLHFLPPGTYNVTIPEPPAGLSSSNQDVDVDNAEHVTDVEIVIS